MSFLGVYRAIYDYAPLSEGELAITEGDLLFVLEKSSEDDWWKAKKKAQNDDEDEPEGLIPATYVEEVRADTTQELECAGGNSRNTPRTALTETPGATHLPGKGPVRVHKTDRRRAFLPRRSPAPSLRHDRRRLDTGRIERRIWLRPSNIHRGRLGSCSGHATASNSSGARPRSRA